MRESFWYTLDENEQPVSMGDWPTRGFKALEVWPPMKTKVDGYEVSTVFLGLDHQHGDGPPLLWETMIFGDGPVPWASGDEQEYQDRYTSADDARAGHAETVRLLREQIIAVTRPDKHEAQL